MEKTDNTEKLGTEARTKINKVLIIGSGALSIGQAGEFDFSGSQCLKALREEKIQTVLINPNIATYQTSDGMADKIYFLPVTKYYVEEVIKKENPDGILLGFGGQTALNCGVELYQEGILKKYDVKVLGTSVQAIIDTEDRALFVKKLNEINVKTPISQAVTTIEEGLSVAEKIGYPVMARVAYALGGKGSGAARNKAILTNMLTKAFKYTNQVLIEEYLGGWKEVEYEVVRDRFDNCITVCNMENFDPLGIHTGESIVVAPSQTLTNHEYHMLREVSIRTIKHIGIVGECNIQFALNPKNDDYRVIEVNARLSRSSALASKATGYPLAFIAAKLSLGHSLVELNNSITKKTCACFEPALDYVVVKMPRWDLHKFKRVSRRIDTEMKSVGEVMAIDRNFEGALQKAIRMLSTGRNGIVCNTGNGFDNLREEIQFPTDERVFAISKALLKGFSVEEICKLSGIDEWFVYKIKNITDLKKQMIADFKLNNKNINKSIKNIKKPASTTNSAGNNLIIDKNLLLRAKKLGYSDRQIAIIYKTTENAVRTFRKKLGIEPVIKQIDTLAAEYPAMTNYLYLTYNGNEDDIVLDCENSKKAVIVLGSGAYRIGSSVEFDWCCVNCINAVKKSGYNTVMINYNPETVSTDYDICDRLYFDELSFETVQDIYEKENPHGMIISMGGQIPNNLAIKCETAGMRILGTHAKSIDNAEDRHKFSKLLDDISVDQPEWKEASSIKEIDEFAEKVGYPLLVRPSYVLSGAAMRVAFDRKNLLEYLNNAAAISSEYPVVISKFISDACEIEMDAVANNGDIIAWAVSEHIENAGVHSGDATIVLPPQKTYIETIRRVKRISRRIAKALNITGPFNIQFIAKHNHVMVIECNLRASRSFPFVSKVYKENLITLATKAILGEKVRTIEKSLLELDYVGVKAPQFSFSRLKGADPSLGVEMASTGEVGCFGDDLHEAFLKSMIATGFKIPNKSVLVSVGGDKSRFKILDSIKKLREMGFKIYATEHTSLFFKHNGIDCIMLHKIHEKKKPSVMDKIMIGDIDLVINVPNQYKQLELDDTYHIRRAAIDFSVPLVMDLQVANVIVDALFETYERRMSGEGLSRKGKAEEFKAWDEY